MDITGEDWLSAGNFVAAVPQAGVAVAAVATSDGDGERLHENAEAILERLADHDGDYFDAGELSNFGKPVTVNHHLDQLHKKHMVEKSYNIDDSILWTIAANGRAYIVEHGLDQ